MDNKLPKESKRLQCELQLLIDNMNIDINNLDENKQIYQLKTEMKENDHLNTLIQNNDRTVEINDLENFYNINKNKMILDNQAEIGNLKFRTSRPDQFEKILII